MCDHYSMPATGASNDAYDVLDGFNRAPRNRHVCMLLHGSYRIYNVVVTSRKHCKWADLLQSQKCFIEITLNFLCPFMNGMYRATATGSLYLNIYNHHAKGELYSVV